MATREELRGKELMDACHNAMVMYDLEGNEACCGLFADDYGCIETSCILCGAYNSYEEGDV